MMKLSKALKERLNGEYLEVGEGRVSIEATSDKRDPMNMVQDVLLDLGHSLPTGWVTVEGKIEKEYIANVQTSSGRYLVAVRHVTVPTPGIKFEVKVIEVGD